MTYRLKNIRTGEIGRTTYATLVMARQAAWSRGDDYIVVDQYGNRVDKPIISFRCFNRAYYR
ncbi:MAG TPA: hypothetical protein VMT30_06205 [Candidatus Saccharimonadia bacterium]|nr:hypothetical protein [Candidatus Saccharimonadia bacterium]